MDKLIWFLSAGVLIAVTAALRAMFGRQLRPGLRYALWGLVLLRLLIPGTVFHSAFSVAGAVQRVEKTAPARSVSTYLTETEVYSGSIRDTNLSFDEAKQQHDGRLHKIQGYSAESDKGNLHTYIFHDTLKNVTEKVLLTVWKVGIAVTALCFLISNLRLYFRLKRRRIRIDTECPLPVYAVDDLSSSCLFLRQIYVSAETADNPEQLRHVLAHELAHYRHLDGFWALLRCAALALHWFDPLVWWAAVLSRRDSELFADASALKALGEDARESYGKTLIELSVRSSGKVSLLNAATAMTGSKKQLKERVRLISKRPKAAFGAIAAVCLIAVIAAGCAFTGAKKEQRTFTPTELDVEVWEPVEDKTLLSADLSVWDGDEAKIRELHGIYTDLRAKAETVALEEVPQSFEPPIYVLHFRDTELGEDHTMQMWSSGLFIFDATPAEDHTATFYQAEDAETYIALFESCCDAADQPASASDLIQRTDAEAVPPDDAPQQMDESAPEYRNTGVPRVSVKSVTVQTAYDYDAVIKAWTEALAAAYLSPNLSDDSPYRCTEATVEYAGEGMKQISLRTSRPQELAFDCCIRLRPADMERYKKAESMENTGAMQFIYLDAEYVLSSEDGYTWSFRSDSEGGVGWRGYRPLSVPDALMEELLDGVTAAYRNQTSSDYSDLLLWAGEFIPWSDLTSEQFSAVYKALKEAAIDENYPKLGPIHDDHLYRDLYMMYAAAKTDGAYAEIFFDPFPDALLFMQYDADPDAFLAALDELPKEISDRITPFLTLIK